LQTFETLLHVRLGPGLTTAGPWPGR
jgi:hypothetical protein